MRKFILPAVFAIALTAPALAADLGGKMITKAPPAPPPSPWDIAFGSALMSDYVFRGVTQSNHKPSVAAYFEPRYNATKDLQFYVGISGESIDFPNHAAAEIDFYGGFRPTFGALALDFGAWYYYYPSGQCFNTAAFGNDCLVNSNGVGSLPNGNVVKGHMSFWEVYAKGVYTAGDWAFGANFYYSPSFMNSGAAGEYLSGTVKWTAPSSMLPSGVGFYLSGELGRQWLGTTDNFYAVAGFPNGIDYADYDTWNIGVGWTWKVFTLDLRYSDTDLSKANCNAFTSDHTSVFTGDFSPINPTGVGS